MAASIQWLVVPWVLAVMVWVGGRAQVGYLVVLAAAFYVPMLFSTVYVSAHKVPLAGRGRWSRKRTVLTVLSGLPYALIFGGALRAYEGGRFDPDGMVGGVIGGVVGLGLAVFAVRRSQQRHSRKAVLVEDLD